MRSCYVLVIVLHETPIVPADTERRRADRYPMIINVQLSQGLRLLAMTRTTDLSSTGFSGSSDIMLQVHQEIGVGINGLGTVRATVAWVRGIKFGARFRDPIDIELVDVSGIIQPHVPLPDWIPERSEGRGQFSGPLMERDGAWNTVQSNSEELPREIPRDPRCKIAARIQMRRSGSKKSNADILDISRTGFQLDCTLYLNEGERFLVLLPGMQPLAAIAVWRDDYRTGCKFENPISEYVYGSLLGRLTG